ncbi:MULTISPECIES: alpha/beta hydrolase [unclassified Nonomuraea]|uniref:alpha/beta hydrolase n=1 Tax=unclassified Nonomuraea TaxID=2593643 RepID=UPI0033E9E14D
MPSIGLWPFCPGRYSSAPVLSETCRHWSSPWATRSSLASQARRMAAEQRPFGVAAYSGMSGSPAWKKISRWAIITTRDKAIDPNGQRWMAKRAKAHVVEVKSSHAISVSHPGAVADAIFDADRGTR